MITIDDYYSIEFYNECIQSIRNNKIEYKEYISTKAPFQFYIDMEPEPVMVNYDKLPDNQQKFVVNTVEPATPNEAYILQRKDALSGIKAFQQYAMNQPLIEAQKAEYACFFEIKNRETALMLSKKYGKIWYFGKYYNNNRIGLCTNKMIQNENIEIYVHKTKSAQQMELDLNFKIFRLNDRLRKFTNTPYFIDGRYKQVKVTQFNMTL